MTMYTEKRAEQRIEYFQRQAIKKICDGEVYLIERRIKGKTGAGERAMCHPNVQQWVNKIGGERVEGWLYVNNKNLIGYGLHTWVWHSVWYTPEKKLVDCTFSDWMKERTQGIFMPDTTRKSDLDSGTFFDNILYVSNKKAVKTLRESYGAEAEVGKLYWTTDNGNNLRLMESEDGKWSLGEGGVQALKLKMMNLWSE